MRTSDIEVTLLDHMGSDLNVVNAARVSFHKESEWDIVAPEGEDYVVHPGDPFDLKLNAQDVKLINYLVKHKHTSPFNHAFLSFRVKAPIFVARQLQKHRFMPWNEVSRRYVDDEPEFYIPQLRKKAENVKQGSSDEVMPDMWTFAGIEHMKNLVAYYNSAIDSGMAPEVARAFLPQNMQTEWVWSGSLGAFADMLRLRLDPHAQYESRIVAEKIHKEMEVLFPVSINALLKGT